MRDQRPVVIFSSTHAWPISVPTVGLNPLSKDYTPKIRLASKLSLDATTILRKINRQTSSPSDRSSDSRRDPEIALDTARQGLSQYFHGHRQPLVFSKDVPLSYHHYSDINGKLVWWFNQLVFRSGHFGEKMECVCETAGNGQVVVVFLVGKCNLILMDIQMLVINVFEGTRTIRGKEKGNMCRSLQWQRTPRRRIVWDVSLQE